MRQFQTTKTTCNFLVSCLRAACFKQSHRRAHLFPFSVFLGIWSLLWISFDSWTGRVWGREKREEEEEVEESGRMTRLRDRWRLSSGWLSPGRQTAILRSEPQRESDRNKNKGEKEYEEMPSGKMNIFLFLHLHGSTKYNTDCHMTNTLTCKMQTVVAISIITRDGVWLASSAFGVSAALYDLDVPMVWSVKHACSGR